MKTPSIADSIRRSISKLRRAAQPAAGDARRVTKHRLRTTWPDGRSVEWNATATPPWKKRATNRRRNRQARISRRINRRTR